jgi:tetratricopeptide (TPR) repeat protein
VQSSTDRYFQRFIAYSQSGETPKLIDAINEFGLTQPDSAAWQSIASDLMRAGHLDASLYVLDAALAQLPQDAELHYLAGNASRVLMKHELAEQHYYDALDLTPRHREAALGFAFMLRQQGRVDEAARVVTASLRHRDADATETLAALGFLRECGAFVAANDIAKRARERWPDDATVAAHAGEFALAVGDFARARECLRDALSRDPNKSASWLRLSLCTKFENADDADIVRMQAAWRNATLTVTTRTCAGFALGKALDDVHDYEHAAATLREANTGARAAQPWHGGAWEEFVTNKIAARPLSRIDNTFAPLFIVGLPRTGTTLLATSLARDTRVRDRGELNWIDGMYTHLVAQDMLRDLASLKTAADVVEKQMRRDDAPAAFYLDKNPLNFRYLDLIAAMFPNAKILHCRRDARDTALSIWMQYFAHADVGFAYDFGTIRDFMRGHETLMAHWKKTLPLKILDVEYEALATEPAKTLKLVGAHLGMDLQTSAATSAAIVTASAWQARQPVYSSSIGRWKNYAPFLPELKTF